MKILMKHIVVVASLLLCAIAQTSCSMIDDNLDNCGSDYQLNYELRLVTNMTTELETQLTTQTEVAVANALRQHLKNIFSDYAHDVDLSFYDTGVNDIRQYHESPTMNANQRSYTIYLPVQKYMHLAAANLKDNSIVSLNGDEHCKTSNLIQKTAAADNILPSHTTGLFTARQPMEVVSGKDQTFNVKLYMANCATALVIEPRNHQVKDIKVYTTGFATGFNIKDSTYVFGANTTLIKAETVTTPEVGDWSFCSVNFPSQDPASRVVIETEDPFVANEEAEKIWEFQVLITNNDGSVTRTVLGIRRPLRAGQLMIIKGFIDDDGSIRPLDSTVGVSVTLNWNEGTSYEPEL